MRTFDKSEIRPAYGPSEAARYVRLPLNKAKRWAELLAVAPSEPVFPISFANLLQLHLLKSMRLEHRVPLQRVRRAIPALREKYGSEYPLLQTQLLTDGLDIFLREEPNEIVNLSNAEQRSIREHFDLYLRRIDLSERVARLYPFVRSEEDVNAPAQVVIRPDIGFGRPTVSGTGIQTQVIAGRFRSGDSMIDLIDEYQLSQEQLEEVIRWEWQAPADAA
jgi:uncharacterized protein (DUF433 family)